MFCQNSSRYAVLIDPSIQITQLSSSDISELVECLDYSRLSTAPRGKSQGGTSEPRPLVSNLPSPFFDDFLNLLPLSNPSRPGDMRFSGVFADDEYFADIPAGPSTRYVDLPTPPPTTTATAIPSTNSSNMHYTTDINGSGRKGRSEGVRHIPGSASRSTFSQHGDPSPTNNSISHQNQESRICSHYQQETEPPQIVQSTPPRPPSFNSVHLIPQPSSYLPHLTSPQPLMTSATTNPAANPRSSLRNVPAPPISNHLDITLEQHQPPHRRLSWSSTHNKSALAGARRPWYEQSQPRQMGSTDDDDGVGQMGMGSGGEGGMVMTGFVGEGKLR